MRHLATVIIVVTCSFYHGHAAEIANDTRQKLLVG
jgi:hypothetical protein